MARSYYPARRSPRAPAYDYSTPGAYFITIVTHGRRELFGDVDGTAMIPNNAGRMIQAWWQELAATFKSVELGASVVMPNHLHGIVLLEPRESGSTEGISALALSQIVGWFKTMTTNAYIRGVREQRWPTYERHLWQRSFYDRILAGPDDLVRVSEYIEANPRLWAEDTENPTAGERAAT